MHPLLLRRSHAARLRASALLCCLLALAAGSALLAQTAPASAAASASQASATPAGKPLADVAAFVKQQFGDSFKVDARIAPVFGDIDGDGDEDLVLVATSPTPLVAEEENHYKVEDPYDAYFGTGNVKITSQFTLHFDGSERDLLIVFDWRQASPHKAKKIYKYVLINTPFDTVSLTAHRAHKKELKVIDVVDQTSMHSLITWDGRRWSWQAQNMGEDDLSLREALPQMETVPQKEAAPQTQAAPQKPAAPQ